MRGVFRDVFQKLGHGSSDILEAPDWPGVLAALRNESVDLLVYDWELPGKEGSQLMWQLKDLGLAGKVMVLFCINRLQRSLVAYAARQGSCDCVEKPFTPESLEAKVRALGGAYEAKARDSSKQQRVVTPRPEGVIGGRFLAQLPTNVREELLKLAMVHRHEAGNTILRAGEVCGFLHFVIQGQAEVLQGAAGRVARVVEEGDPFGELSFMTTTPSPESVRTKTRVQTASVSKANLTELLRKEPTMAIHLSALMARHKGTMHSRATTLEHTDFKGTFDTMPFADVIQMLIATKKTGVLGVRGEQDRGAMYMEDGEAVHAWTDVLQGEEAFFAIASWQKAKFAFTSIARNEPRTLNQPTITLLMKAMRHQEQAGRGT